MTSEPRLGSSHSIDASQRSHRPARRRVRDPDERLHVWLWSIGLDEPAQSDFGSCCLLLPIPSQRRSSPRWTSTSSPLPGWTTSSATKRPRRAGTRSLRAPRSTSRTTARRRRSCSTRWRTRSTSPRWCARTARSWRSCGRRTCGSGASASSRCARRRRRCGSRSERTSSCGRRSRTPRRSCGSFRTARSCSVGARGASEWQWSGSWSARASWTTRWWTTSWTIRSAPSSTTSTSPICFLPYAFSSIPRS